MEYLGQALTLYPAARALTIRATFVTKYPLFEVNIMITWNTDVNAPCCPGEILSDDEKQSIVVQSDWDYPGTASTFGWSVRNVQECDECGHVHTKNVDGEQHPLCEHCSESLTICAHDHTDGTVDCHVCGLSASDFIEAAGQWLYDNDGATADDPGYFE